MYLKCKTHLTNYMVKSGSGSGRICFTNPAKSDSGRISGTALSAISDKPIQYVISQLFSPGLKVLERFSWKLSVDCRYFVSVPVTSYRLIGKKVKSVYSC